MPRRPAGLDPTDPTALAAARRLAAPPPWRLVERDDQERSAAAPDALALGDSRELAQAVASSHSFACIYIDPPFGTGKVRHGRGLAYRDVDDDPEPFVSWLAPWLEASRDALSDTGSLFVHLDFRAVHYVKVALDRLFGRGHLVNELVWCYSVGGKGRRGFGRKHDTILWYARGGDWAFYPDAVRVARRGGSHMRVTLDEHGHPVQEKTDRKTGRVYRYPVADGKVPEDWWTDIETLNHSDRERTGWPSQKPERLLERILLATTRAGDRVADWFSGSATTAAVAQRLGRGFLGADLEPTAVAVARQRLRQQAAELARAGTPAPVTEIWAHPAVDAAVLASPAGPRAPASRRDATDEPARWGAAEAAPPSDDPGGDGSDEVG
jgi:DNA modification methylase